VPTSLPASSVAVVTGAGRGIGRAAALALAAGGWKVALVARRASDLEAVAGEAGGQGGVVLVCPADVSDRLSAEAAVEKACAELGPPIALVNNAAVVGPVAPVASADPQSWKQALDINLAGAFYMARAVLQRMTPAGRGTILNLVSGMGVRVFARFSAYSVSKAGLILLTRVLAEETRSGGITVNALDPGLVDTDMHEQLARMPPETVGAEMSESLNRYRRLNLFKPPERIGRWIADFLSGKAWEITGEVGTLAEFESRHGIPANLETP
jgi:3-oxoacyl-[acyl-carrier protein] reductase